jgi:hypothetical protein
MSMSIQRTLKPAMHKVPHQLRLCATLSCCIRRSSAPASRLLGCCQTCSQSSLQLLWKQLHSSKAYGEGSNSHGWCIINTTGGKAHAFQHNLRNKLMNPTALLKRSLAGRVLCLLRRSQQIYLDRAPLRDGGCCQVLQRGHQTLVLQGQSRQPTDHARCCAAAEVFRACTRPGKSAGGRNNAHSSC